jgi:hypothetical protein
VRKFPPLSVPDRPPCLPPSPGSMRQDATREVRLVAMMLLSKSPPRTLALRRMGMLILLISL